VCFYFFLHD
jgi:hypothetical protein